MHDTQMRIPGAWQHRITRGKTMPRKKTHYTAITIPSTSRHWNLRIRFLSSLETRVLPHSQGHKSKSREETPINLGVFVAKPIRSLSRERKLIESIDTPCGHASRQFHPANELAKISRAITNCPRCTIVFGRLLIPQIQPDTNRHSRHRRLIAIPDMPAKDIKPTFAYCTQSDVQPRQSR